MKKYSIMNIHLSIFNLMIWLICSIFVFLICNMNVFASEFLPEVIAVSMYNNQGTNCNYDYFSNNTYNKDIYCYSGVNAFDTWINYGSIPAETYKFVFDYYVIGWDVDGESLSDPLWSSAYMPLLTLYTNEGSTASVDTSKCSNEYISSGNVSHYSESTVETYSAYRFTCNFSTSKTWNGIKVYVPSSREFLGRLLLYETLYNGKDVNIDTSINNDITNIIIDDDTDLIIENQNSNQQQTNERLDELNDTNKGILETIKNIPSLIVNGFLDMLKSLFIPSEQDLQDIIDDSQKISENFGFIGQAFSFLIDVFTNIVDLSRSDGCVALPDLTLKFGGILGMSDYTLWQEQNVCISQNPWFGNDSEAIDIIRFITTGGLVAAFVSFAISQFNQILSKEETET